MSPPHYSDDYIRCRVRFSKAANSLLLIPVIVNLLPLYLIVPQRRQDHMKHRWIALTFADHHRFEETEEPADDGFRGQAARFFQCAGESVFGRCVSGLGTIDCNGRSLDG